jgi:hypothetical protein
LVIFNAIGFDVPDDEAYQALAELAEARGERSRVHRRGVTLTGHCWQVGGGIEVWTIVHEGNDGPYYADCRPAFRARTSQPLRRWELLEYDDDGEAVLNGSIGADGLRVSFDLQNLTEIPDDALQSRELNVVVSGLAYGLSADAQGPPGIGPSRIGLATAPPDGSDYRVVGRVLKASRVENSHTGRRLTLVHLDAGSLTLEVLTGRETDLAIAAPGRLLEAEVWLQGHVLTKSAVLARYEGVDPEWGVAEAWQTLRREN